MMQGYDGGEGGTAPVLLRVLLPTARKKEAPSAVEGCRVSLQTGQLVGNPVNISTVDKHELES